MAWMKITPFFPGKLLKSNFVTFLVNLVPRSHSVTGNVRSGKVRQYTIFHWPLKKGCGNAIYSPIGLFRGARNEGLVFEMPGKYSTISNRRPATTHIYAMRTYFSPWQTSTANVTKPFLRKPAHPLRLNIGILQHLPSCFHTSRFKSITSIHCQRHYKSMSTIT